MPTPFAQYTRIPVTVPNPTGQKMDPFNECFAFPRKPVQYDPFTLDYAQWWFGPDAESLESISSGHVATATGTLSYNANSVTTPAANNQGIDLNIVDRQTFTAWCIIQVPAGLAAVMGTSAADTDTVGWWLRFTGAGVANIAARGTTFSNGNLPMPAGVVAGTSFVFLCVSSDAGNFEAWCGGGASARVSAGPFAPHSRDVALGALYSISTAYSQAVRVVEAGYIDAVGYTLTQKQALYAARKAAVLTEKSITVL